MEEYEYSFKVDNISFYIKYCEDNSYKLISKCIQNRIVYENIYNKDLIARITKENKDNKEITLFDCKNVSENNNLLKVSNESIPIEVTEYNKKEIYSLLDVLGFKETSNLERIRYEYILDDVKFEIDEYIKPKMSVVAIEGNRNKVDGIYKDVKKYCD